jgi:hypothetical protein
MDNELLESELLQLAQELSDREEQLNAEVEAKVAKRVEELDSREEYIKAEELRIKQCKRDLFIEQGKFNLDKAAYIKANAPIPVAVVVEDTKTEQEKLDILIGHSSKSKRTAAPSVDELLSRLKANAGRA